MKYSPCIDQCTSEGSHCAGCGRSHQEITDTKRLVSSVVDFIREHEYENPEDFVDRISKSILKKLQKPA